ncbi:MAG: hypothetical protein KDK39_11660 [Leptospiraceae bacterium]|nr:hypothetical protein [Leptospiraceae bacterium]
MKVKNLFLIEGIFFSALGGILLFVGHLINFSVNNGQITVAGQTIIFFSHSFLIFSFISAQYVLKPNIQDSLALDLSIIGSVFVCAIVFSEIAMAFNPELKTAIDNPVTNNIINFAPLLFVLGLILFSISLIRMDYKKPGILLLVGNLVFAASTLFSVNLASVISLIGSFFTGLGFLYFGISLRLNNN